MRLTDDELRALLDPAYQHHSPETVRVLVEELLERRISERFFLDQDNSFHWYLVEEKHRTDWNKWRDLPDDDEAGWNTPPFAKRLDGGASEITFTDPKGTK